MLYIKMVKIIDLSGPDGNAYALLSYVNEIGTQLGFESSRIQTIKNEMKKGDYEHLLSVFYSNFKAFVELRRNDEVFVPVVA
jgi:hypothetical protein